MKPWTERHRVYKKKAKEKFILAIHGGKTDDSNNLFPTEGTLRLENDDLMSLVLYIESQELRQITLIIREKRIGFWKRFVTSKVSRKPANRISTSYYRGLPHDPDLIDSDNPWLWLWLYEYETRSIAEETEFNSVGGTEEVSSDTPDITTSEDAS